MFTIPAIAASGWPRSRRPACADGPSNSISNWTCCSTCASKPDENYCRKVASIRSQERIRTRTETLDDQSELITRQIGCQRLGQFAEKVCLGKWRSWHGNGELPNSSSTE